MNTYKRLLAGAALLGLFAVPLQSASAAVTVTDTVGASGKFLLTGMTVNATSPGSIKFVFSNLTAGTNLQLCAGSSADFGAGTCAMELSSSGGPASTPDHLRTHTVEREIPVREARCRRCQCPILADRRVIRGFGASSPRDGGRARRPYVAGFASASPGRADRVPPSLARLRAAAVRTCRENSAPGASLIAQAHQGERHHRHMDRRGEEEQRLGAERIHDDAASVGPRPKRVS